MNSKILIVEDDASSAHPLATLLRRAGHDIAVACSCREALEVAASEKLGLVLCDIGLPDGDGCDLIRELKAMYQLPAIAVSGFDAPGDRERYTEAGFTELVTKPYSLEQISAAIVRARLFSRS
jgi:CheY-like chemotaxis protein